MATITIKINRLGSLADSADGGRGVTGRLNTYWDDLHSKVQKRIDSYSGDKTTNVVSARNYTSQYMGELQTLKSEFVAFAKKAQSLKEEADNIEKNVIRTINNNLSAFCRKHGLEYNPSSEEPGFWAGLWNSLVNFAYDLKDVADSFWEHFREWFHYDGGKQILEGIMAVALAIVAVVVAVLAFPVTLAGLTIWGVITAAAAFITAVIAIVNAVTKITYAVDAVSKAVQDKYFDAAWAEKKRDEGKFSEWMRDQGWYDAANLLDTVELIASVINFVDSLGKTFQKAGEFFHNFSLKGALRDFRANFKEFFGKDTIKHLLFGVKYDGNFFGGELIDVAKRIKTVLTVVDTTYKELTYHDPTGNKSGETKFWERLDIAKPVINIAFTNTAGALTTRRHDMVTDPQTMVTGEERIVRDSNGNEVRIQTTTVDVVDSSTGKKTGTKTTNVATYADGSSTTSTTTEYTYEGKNGVGERKIIYKEENATTSGSKETYTKTYTDKTTNDSSWSKRENTRTVTTEETRTHQTAAGNEHSRTTTNSVEIKETGKGTRTSTETVRTDTVKTDLNIGDRTVTSTYGDTSTTTTNRKGTTEAITHENTSDVKVQTNAGKRSGTKSSTTAPKSDAAGSTTQTKDTKKVKPETINERVDKQSKPDFSDIPDKYNKIAKDAEKLAKNIDPNSTLDVPSFDDIEGTAGDVTKIIVESNSPVDIAKNIKNMVEDDG